MKFLLVFEKDVEVTISDCFFKEIPSVDVSISYEDNILLHITMKKGESISNYWGHYSFAYTSFLVAV